MWVYSYHTATMLDSRDESLMGFVQQSHPKRSAADFGPEMDRFSFITIDLSLRAIAQNSSLFSKYSNGENIIFTANDFIDPGRSAAFADLSALPALARDAGNFARICVARLCCTNPMRDSSRESSMVAVWYE